jgi:hypothetical protein
MKEGERMGGYEGKKLRRAEEQKVRGWDAGRLGG